jgi:hypothetical protein
MVFRRFGLPASDSRENFLYSLKDAGLLLIMPSSLVPGAPPGEVHPQNVTSTYGGPSPVTSGGVGGLPEISFSFEALSP